MKVLLACFLGLAPGVTGCSHTDNQASVAGSDAAPAIAFSTGATIAASAEMYACKFVAMPRAPVFIVGFSHSYSAGYHHLFAFRTDLTSLPAGGDVETDCYAGASNPMAHARASLYAAESPSGSLALPAGVALPAVAGEVLLLQAHYLNATASAIDAKGSLTVDYTTADTHQHAGAYFFYDPFIDVGVRQQGTATMRCAVPSAISILSTVGAAHSRAVGFEAFADPPSAATTSAFYQAPGWVNPLPLVSTIPLAAGSHVRFLCAYDNTTGTTEFLQGTNEDTSEQCILSGLYYPELTSAFDDCSVDPDGFGSGSNACLATESCIDACAPSAAPPADLGLGGEPAIDPCWQRCMVSSCPDASGLFLALRACVATHCASECEGAAGDAGTGCAGCTAAACAGESAACIADACK